MAVSPIQTNIDNTKSHRHYNEANKPVKTKNNVKPLAPEGHLVHDRLMQMPKFFWKDFAYDLKAVRDGFRGNANDHQTGRLNDVGIKLGGVGIATMLAARTTNPVARIMEYAGLGAFLAAMSIFPKIAIQAPSRVMHGFDTGIEYIDDQGRKKSVFQDSNYIPFDMYQGERPSEDLDIIGDRLGIPRNIKNRHDVIKEQMRKIATQNNTLWMLTAGFATPVIAALTCFGLERLIAPAYANVKNMSYNSRITQVLKNTSEMTLDPNEIGANNVSKKVEAILKNYRGKEIPKSELDSVVDILTKDMPSSLSDGIRKDLISILEKEKNGYKLADNAADDIILSIKKSLPKNNQTLMEKIFIPTKEEMAEILKGHETVSGDDLIQIKGKLKELFANKIKNDAKLSNDTKEYLKAFQNNNLLENISKNLQKEKSLYLSDQGYKEILDFSKILGEFKHYERLLDKYKSFKFEHTSETVLARYYAKFEKTLFNVLDINFKDLKQMKESEKYAKEILDAKLTALTKDEKKYNKAIEKLTKVMSEMDVALNGRSANESHIKDLITAIENNYNNTAKRLDKAGSFKNTIDKLVKEDVNTLSNSINSREELFDFLDGIRVEKSLAKEKMIEKATENAKGVGSAKESAISRIFERYQGANNSFNRFLHTMDVYKREIPNGEYDKAILQKGKDILLTGTSSENALKHNMVNNASFYKDVMNTIYQVGQYEGSAPEHIVKGKGYLTDATKNAIKENEIANGKILDRLQNYINRFRNIIGNKTIDFTKPGHVLDNNIRAYEKSQKPMTMFNLVAQSPVDFIKGAANRRYGTQKWLRIVSTIGASVLGATVLAQYGFGKLKNPHNLMKQVSDDKNS